MGTTTLDPFGKDPPSMVVLVLLMLAILVVAGAVVVYVAYPHRGEEVPGAPWLGEAMRREVDTVSALGDLPPDRAGAADERQREPSRS